MIHRYVNTASAGGDGTTAALAGVHAAWSSQNSAELALRASAFADDLSVHLVGTDYVSTTWNASFPYFADNTRTLNLLAVPGTYVLTSDNISPTTGKLQIAALGVTPFNVVIDGPVITVPVGFAVADPWRPLLLAGGPSIVIRRYLFINLSDAITDCAAIFASNAGVVKVENSKLCAAHGLVSCSTKGFHRYFGPTDVSLVNTLLQNLAVGTYAVAPIHVRNCEFVACTTDIGAGGVDGTSANNATNQATHVGTGGLINRVWANEFNSADVTSPEDALLVYGSSMFGAGAGPTVDALVPSVDWQGAARSGPVCTIGPYERDGSYAVPLRIDYRQLRTHPALGLVDNGAPLHEVKAP